MTHWNELCQEVVQRMKNQNKTKIVVLLDEQTMEETNQKKYLFEKVPNVYLMANSDEEPKQIVYGGKEGDNDDEEYDEDDEKSKKKNASSKKNIIDICRLEDG